MFSQLKAQRLSDIMNFLRPIEVIYALKIKYMVWILV